MGSMNLPAYEQAGRRIREERLRAGLTLSELARRVGVSASYISLIENSKAAPSLKILDQICTSLSIHISTLFTGHEEKAPDSYTVFRKDAHVVLDVSAGRRIHMLLPKDNLPLQVVRAEIQPGDGYDSFSAHEGMEFGYVLRGEIEFNLREADGSERSVACRAGDSVLYDAMRPHRFLNRGAGEAELMLTAVSTMTNTGRR